MDKSIHTFIKKEEGMLNGIPFFLFDKNIYI